ncbi:hypothetical protein CEXT_480921 [Caerostris extrusa]|uniref:Uncharacterized protein n=1 Tax=Caerostris extrusa TaxID=172846 RepID=A0AAV4RA34_CAEEX|nr:hypothetical protein CEXT_480921 [Caerostris extrusa]
MTWEDVSCECVRNMETDSSGMLSAGSLRGLSTLLRRPSSDPILSVLLNILQEQLTCYSLSLPATLGVGCNRNLTTRGFCTTAPPVRK